MLNVKIVTEYSKVSVQMWLPLSRPRYHYCSILSIFFSPILSFHQHNIVVGQVVGKRTHLGISGKGKVPNNKVLLCSALSFLPVCILLKDSSGGRQVWITIPLRSSWVPVTPL